MLYYGAVMNEIPFGKRLGECMQKRGVDTKTLADSLDIKENFLQALLRGDRLPKGKRIKKIAITLKVSADYLLGLSDE